MVWVYSLFHFIVLRMRWAEGKWVWVFSLFHFIVLRVRWAEGKWMWVYFFRSFKSQVGRVKWMWVYSLFHFIVVIGVRGGEDTWVWDFSLYYFKFLVLTPRSDEVHGYGCFFHDIVLTVRWAKGHICVRL